MNVNYKYEVKTVKITPAFDKQKYAEKYTESFHRNSLKLHMMETQQELVNERTLREELARTINDISQEKSEMKSKMKVMEEQVVEMKNECATLKERYDSTVKTMQDDLRMIEDQTSNEKIK